MPDKHTREPATDIGKLVAAAEAHRTDAELQQKDGDTLRFSLQIGIATPTECIAKIKERCNAAGRIQTHHFVYPLALKFCQTHQRNPSSFQNILPYEENEKLDEEGLRGAINSTLLRAKDLHESQAPTMADNVAAHWIQQIVDGNEAPVVAALASMVDQKRTIAPRR